MAHRTRLLISIALLSLGAFLLAQWQDAFAAGFSYSDEGPHFLNVLFFTDYVKHHLGENPITVAKDLYLHYPKLALGHWPPLGYWLISIPFLVLPLTTVTIMMVNTLIAILPALYIVFVLAGRVSLTWLLLACAAWVILPINQFAYRYFMIDQLLAFVILAATVAWVRFGEAPVARRALWFGILAGAALLIKANGAVLAFVPVLQALFTKRFLVLARNRYTYLAAGLPLLMAGPWYALTYTIPAKGMSYQAGLDYSLLSLASNMAALSKNLGILGFLFLVIGVFDSWSNRERNPEIWLWASASLAILLSVLVFHAIVPIALDERYLSTALPPAIVLAALGARAIASLWGRWLTPRTATGLAGALLMASVLPGLGLSIHGDRKVDLRMREVAETILQKGGPAIWAIDGGSGSGPEGALAAELASLDEGRNVYLMRGSKAFTESDFLGRSIRAKYDTAADILALLRNVGVQGVVICRNPGNPNDSVNDILRVALETSGSGYRLLERLPHLHRPGETRIYVAESVIPPNVDALRSINVPRISSKG